MNELIIELTKEKDTIFIDGLGKRFMSYNEKKYSFSSDASDLGLPIGEYPKKIRVISPKSGSHIFKVMSVDENFDYSGGWSCIVYHSVINGKEYTLHLFND